MISASAVYRIIKEFVPNFLESYESDYSTRLKVQKIIYLFEQFIDDDSYGFSWYLAGPYSSVLTHQVYSEIVSASKIVGIEKKYLINPNGHVEIIIGNDIIKVEVTFKLKDENECVQLTALNDYGFPTSQTNFAIV